MQPGTKMTLVHANGLGQWLCMAALLHPLGIVPGVRVEVSHDRSGLWARLLLKPVGIRFLVNMTVLILNLKLVAIALTHFRNKQIPDAIANLSHLVLAAIPVVKITQNRRITGIGCPYSKIDPLDPVHLGQVGTHLFIDAMVITLSKQVDVKFSEVGRSKSIGVIDHPLVITLFDPELIVGEVSTIDRALKEMRMVSRLHQVLCPLLRKNDPNRISARL